MKVSVWRELFDELAELNKQAGDDRKAEVLEAFGKALAPAENMTVAMMMKKLKDFQTVKD